VRIVGDSRFLLTTVYADIRQPRRPGPRLEEPAFPQFPEKLSPPRTKGPVIPRFRGSGGRPALLSGCEPSGRVRAPGRRMPRPHYSRRLHANCPPCNFPSSTFLRALELVGVAGLLGLVCLSLSLSLSLSLCHPLSLSLSLVSSSFPAVALSWGRYRTPPRCPLLSR
jgi:hypothetical protein